MNSDNSGSIPKKLNQDLDMRDQTELGPEALLKYQFISLAPGIYANYRYMIMRDGRIFYSANTDETPTDPKTIYNKAYPRKPVRVLLDIEIKRIIALLDEVQFFKQPAYQVNQARDGSMVIITARLGDRLHETWYVNIHNPLVDYLGKLSPEEPVQKTSMDENREMEEILREQEKLLKKLENEYADPDEDRE